MNEGKFPDPVLPPHAVYEARVFRLKQVLGSITQGALIRFCVMGIELIGFFWLGGQALLLDALSTLFDILCSIALIIFVQLAAKPPDSNHPFGHGKLEPLAGFQLGLFLSLVGGFLCFQQLYYFASGQTLGGIEPGAWIIPLIAVALLEIAYRSIIKTAKLQKSHALLADAAHYRADAINSMIAAVTLFLADFLPDIAASVDHAGAALIAFVMVILGWRVAKENVDQLMDRRPDDKFFERVKKAAKNVAGVQDTEKIQIQMSGPTAHVDIDVEVDPSISVEVAHKITQKVRCEIQKEWPEVADVTVHVEPYYANDHDHQ